VGAGGGEGPAIIKNEYPQSSKFNRVCTAIIVLGADFAAVLLSNRKELL